MPEDLPPPALLRKLLRYELETGKLFWRERPVDMFSSPLSAVLWNGRYAEKEAFTSQTPDGYLRGSILDKSFLKHRVIWALVTGRWPCYEIDHINGSKEDNRWANLRESTSSQNKWNAGPQKRNKSGYKGVSWHTSKQKWRAVITRFRTQHHLGYFDCPQQAYYAYCRAAKKMHGEFAHTTNTKTPEDFL